MESIIIVIAEIIVFAISLMAGAMACIIAHGLWKQEHKDKE